MSLSPRKAASLLGAAALGVMTMTGAGWAAGSAAPASAPGPSFSKLSRFIQLAGDTHTVNRELEAKARALAGLKGYVTNLAACPDGTPLTADFVISACHRLFEIEKSFRMAKGDLQARPIYHRTRDFIEAINSTSGLAH